MEAVFLRVLNMSLAAADVIGVVVLVRLLLRRAPKKWRYLLWIVVAFRLCCPVSFSAPFSAFRFMVQPAAVTQSAERAASEITYIPQDIGLTAEPRVYVGSPVVSEYVSQSLPRAMPWDSANPLQIYIPICVGLWCLGTAALLLYGLISYVNLRRRLRDAVRLDGGVYETDAVRAPFILGLFSPTVYLPVGLTGETLRYVLAHERFHIRRGDHAVKLLAFLLLTVHWFNPLVWLAFALMCRDMEMRCDEAVLSAESGITKPYSMTLLSFAAERRFPSPSPLCFGETSVKERIRNILCWKKPKPWVTVAAALVCVAAVAACAVNPSREKTAEGTPWDWTSTVTAADIKSVEGNGVTLDAEQTQELVELLNAVKPEEVVRGRGIPSNQVLDVTTGVGYRLRWAGGVIELDFDDAAAAEKLYGSPETLGPGVWEIHNHALYAFLEGLETGIPASGGAPVSAPARHVPTFRDEAGRELSLNMNLEQLNAQLDTYLEYGYIYTLPQHRLSAAAGHTTIDGAQVWPVVELGFAEGWTISEGPGIGATADEVRAYWGEPDEETDPDAPNPAQLYALGYALEDGLIQFIHRGDGVIQTINLYDPVLLENPEENEALFRGNRMYWHGRGSSHIENFSCFGELFVQCVAGKVDTSGPGGHYRMAVTAADGTETVLAEGEDACQITIPAPRIENGLLDVELEGEGGAWILEINWFPPPEES